MTDREILAATVAIVDAQGVAKGTAFLVTPEGLLATCAHVLHRASWKPGATVSIEFRGLPQPAPTLKVTATVEAFDEKADLAILQLADPVPDGVRPLPLCEPRPEGGRPIRAVGYPKGLEQAFWAHGTIVAAQADGTLQLSSAEITMGFSGGPVWDKADECVVAVAQVAQPPDELARLRDTSHAIPSTRLRLLNTNIAIRPTPTLLEGSDARGRQVASVYKRYFLPRIIPGLFVDPPDFTLHYNLFRRDPSAIDSTQRGLADEAVAVRNQLLNTVFSSFCQAADCAAFEQPLVDAGIAIAADDLPSLQRELEALERLVAVLETRLEQAPPPRSEAEADLRDEFSEALRSVRDDLGSLFAEASRAVRRLWFLVTPAGRGKSTFAAQVATRLLDDGDCVCVLVGPDLNGDTPIEEIIVRQLHLNRTVDFLLAGEELWKRRGRPFFLVIDAINESGEHPAKVAAQLGRFLALTENCPWLRVLVTCRDLYWDLVFSKDLDGFLDEAQVDRQHAVAPQLNDQGIGAYLKHFKVGNIQPDDFVGVEWTGNPLFLRIFCEVNAGASYQGPKPIQVSAFDLLRRYFQKKQEELGKRTFGAIELEPILDRLATKMVERGNSVPAEGGVARLALPTVDAGEILSQKSRSDERLFEALIDLDLVLRVDISTELQTFVAFTFERMQDYFVARVALEQMRAAREEITDQSFANLRASGAFTDSSLATTLALAIDRGVLQSLDRVVVEAQSSLTAILDLVNPEALSRIGGSVADMLVSSTPMAQLQDYLEAQVRSQSTDRRAFAESLGVGFLTDAVWRLELPERHLRFYAKREFIDAVADVLEVETERMREWVRGAKDFPAHYSAEDGRIRTVILLLGSNSPQVRDIAHEWLFWFGHFHRERVYALVEQHLTVDDLLVRERIVALAHALLSRHTDLATRERLLRIFRSTLDTAAPTFTPHYLIAEFARKTLLRYRDRFPDLLSPHEWEIVAAPRRRRAAPRTPEVYSHSAEPEWTVRGPIYGDQSRYTFGHQFSCFQVPNRDVAVRIALRLLPRLGYDEEVYDEVDRTIAKQGDNPRIWNRSGRRYERFGKTYGYVASWLVMGRWATSKPIKADIGDPVRPFALDHPGYDAFFGVEPAESSIAPAVLDFPETQTWDEWRVSDEAGYLHSFAAQFLDEEILYGTADRIKGERSFKTLTRCVFVPPTLRNAFSWACNHLARLRQSWWNWLGDHSENFEFDALGEETFPQNPFEDDSSCPAYSVRVRTLTDRDRTVITASSRLIQAGRFVQSPVSGEFFDKDGVRVVRVVRWRNIEEGTEGDLTLIRRTALEEACERLGVAYGFFEFTTLSGLGRNGSWDEDPDHLIQRWTGRFPGAAEAPPFLAPVMREWEEKHGALALGFDALVQCFHEADIGGEAALRAALEARVPRQSVRSVKGTQLSAAQIAAVHRFKKKFDALSEEDQAKLLEIMATERTEGATRGTDDPEEE